MNRALRSFGFAFLGVLLISLPALAQESTAAGGYAHGPNFPVAEFRHRVCVDRLGI